MSTVKNALLIIEFLSKGFKGKWLYIMVDVRGHQNKNILSKDCLCSGQTMIKYISSPESNASDSE